METALFIERGDTLWLESQGEWVTVHRVIQDETIPAVTVFWRSELQSAGGIHHYNPHDQVPVLNFTGYATA